MFFQCLRTDKNRCVLKTQPKTTLSYIRTFIINLFTIVNKRIITATSWPFWKLSATGSNGWKRLSCKEIKVFLKPETDGTIDMREKLHLSQSRNTQSLFHLSACYYTPYMWPKRANGHYIPVHQMVWLIHALSTRSTKLDLCVSKIEKSKKDRKEKWGQLICPNSGDYIHILQKDPTVKPHR